MVDVLILLSPSIAVFLYLLLRGPRQQNPTHSARRDRARPPPVVVDGSNVMFWRDNTPQLDTLVSVVAALRQAGWQPVVWFDANAGYHLVGRFAHERDFARFLGLSVRQIVVVPKGTPADPQLLAGARELRAPVVSNDRFRDWQADYGDVLAGPMIRGRIGADGLVFETVTPTALVQAA